jgi:hypothetical protein
MGKLMKKSDEAKEGKSSEPKGSKEIKERQVDLGPCGEAILRLSADRKRLLIEFRVVAEGFDKSGLNGLIDALERVRDKMHR